MVPGGGFSGSSTAVSGTGDTAQSGFDLGSGPVIQAPPSGGIGWQSLAIIGGAAVIGLALFLRAK